MGRSRRRIIAALIVLALAGAAASCGQSESSSAEPTVTSTVAPVASTMPQGPYIPTGDEIILQDDGSFAVSEVMVVILESDTEDLEATILDIAQVYGGTVVGAVPDLRGYELRFAGYDLEALTTLAETILARPDVDFASPSYVSKFDPDF